jgi:DNA-binding transcriptional ArsR family regulator
MGATDAGARKLSKIIEHPIRARIIELLGEKGSMGWKELSSELGVKTGALYHHLDMLEGLVERDPSKKYFLTKSGTIVYSRTSESRTIEAVRKAALDISREGGSRRMLVSLFAPRTLIGRLTSTDSSSSLVVLLTTAALLVYLLAAGISPTLYFLRPDPGVLPTAGGLSASLASLIVVGYGSARSFLGSTVELLPLAAASCLSFLPVLAASVLTQIPATSTLLSSSSLAFTLILVFFQTWSSAVFGAGLSVSTGVRMEKTMLVSLAILYSTMVAMLLLGAKA